jgi:hypothetical protein
MFLNMASMSRLINVGEPLIYYRRLPGSESRKTPEYSALEKANLEQKSKMLSAGKTVSKANSDLVLLMAKLISVPGWPRLGRGLVNMRWQERYVAVVSVFALPVFISPQLWPGISVFILSPGAELPAAPVESCAYVEGSLNEMQN